MTPVAGFISFTQTRSDRALAAMTNVFSALGFSDADTWKHSSETGLTAALASVSRPARAGPASPKAHIFRDGRGRSLVLDGQLYDRRALIERLEIKSQSQPEGDRRSEDASLILNAYHQWGEHCVDHLNGDFALVLVDAKAQRALIARDPIGVKPLYYIDDGETVLLASHVKALLAARPDADDLDEDHLLRCLTGGNYYSPTDTFFTQIKKLPAAHSMTVSSEGITVRRYWRPEMIRSRILGTDAHYQTRLLSILSEAVQDRLETAGGTGVHITGGLDSSMVATLTKNHLKDMSGEPPLGYCWQPPPDASNAGSNEHRWIGRIIDHTKIETKFITPTADGLEAIYRRDCTVESCDKTLYNEHPVQVVASRDGVSTILSGWGGDQIISHRGKTVRHEFAVRVRKAMSGPVARRWVHPWILSLLRRLVPTLMDRQEASSHERPDRERHVAAAYRERAAYLNSQPTLAPAGLRGRQLWYLQEGLIIRRVEEWAASGQEFGIEYRYPLLDKRVVEFALSMPRRQYRRGSKNRYVFRRTLARIAPTDLSWSDTKLEVERVGALRGAFVEMTRRLAADLKSGAVIPRRRRYVDIEALISTIESDEFSLSSVYGPAQTALRILDFPPETGDARHSR